MIEITTSPTLSVGNMDVEAEPRKPRKLFTFILTVWLVVAASRAFCPVIATGAVDVGVASVQITELSSKSPPIDLVRSLLV